MNITASLVKELRELTGAGMMDCKKYLVRTDGNLEEAIHLIRVESQVKVDKVGSRVAAEGICTTVFSTEGTEHVAYIAEINSETDFAARDSNFMSFAEQLVNMAMHYKTTDVEVLSGKMMVGTDLTIEQARQQLISKIGENIQVRRISSVTTDGAIGTYLHAGSRIGVVVALKNGDEALAKDIAMHIAASRPIVISREQVPASNIETERNVFTAQALESGKPQEIIDRMIEGQISKYLKEVSLLDQPFVKNSDITVAQLLKDKNAEVISFIRFAVGDGIEKKEVNFAEEVMSQVRS